MAPKAFISYSWTSPGYQKQVLAWAEQLVADGVEVVLDLWDLKEGQDKYAFMERMVTDETVTHVLVLTDAAYARKADLRKAGVGTESQIISKEVYESVDQQKFIPVVCEVDEEGQPHLPTFLKSRIWIDFSSPEAVNANWEQLVRVLHGKPAVERPELGKPPAYLEVVVGSPASPAISKFNALRQAVLRGNGRLAPYRRDFLDSCIAYSEALRVRQKPGEKSHGQQIVDDCGKLKNVRNHIVDWVLLESEATAPQEFAEELIAFLERLLEQKARPADVTSWSDDWFDAHKVFVYETFLYVVAALIKTRSFAVLNELFTTHYLLSETESRGGVEFGTFDMFYGYSERLRDALDSEGQRLRSPAAELIKRQADREDVPFAAVIEAELLVLLMAFLSPGARWYPQTLIYAPYGRAFPFFVRATQHKHFLKLATVTGIPDADVLRTAVMEGQERMGVDNWQDFTFDRTFWESMNMDKLDTLK